MYGRCFNGLCNKQTQKARISHSFDAIALEAAMMTKSELSICVEYPAAMVGKWQGEIPKIPLSIYRAEGEAGLGITKQI